MPLKSSVVIFQASKLCNLNDLYSLNNFSGLNYLNSLISSKELLNLMVGSSLAPKWPIPVHFCWRDHQKSFFSLIFDILSVRGCWVSQCYFFETWLMKLKFPNLLNPLFRHHNLIKLYILLPLRADFLCTLQCETPCNSGGRTNTGLYWFRNKSFLISSMTTDEMERNIWKSKWKKVARKECTYKYITSTYPRFLLVHKLLPSSLGIVVWT